jgi:hypothetical protein
VPPDTTTPGPPPSGTPGAAPRGGASLPARIVKAFAMFWWDFLVGDTPEFFVGVLMIVGVVLALVKATSLNAAAVVAFPGLVVVLLAGSVLQAKRAQR